MPETPPFYTQGGNYNPGDWPQVLDTQAANETAFTDEEGQELSTAVQPTEAAVAALDISGDDRSWAGEVAEVAVGAPSTLNPDIQGKQASQTPYVLNHLSA